MDADHELSLDKKYPPERNPLVRAWIRFWYNDATRLVFVLCGAHLLLVVPFLLWLGLDGEAMKNTVLLAYGAVFAWALFDNDYENLRRIGRRP